MDNTDYTFKLKNMNYEEKIDEYCQFMKNKLSVMDDMDKEKFMMSIINEMSDMSVRKRNIWLEAGMIVYVDFGRQKLYESSYCRPALILSVVGAKAFVVPITSSQRAVDYSHSRSNPLVYRLKLNDIKAGLNNISALHLNDSKYISINRVIKLIGKMDVNSSKFQNIMVNVMALISDTSGEKKE